MSGLGSTSAGSSVTYGTNVPPVSFPGIASGIDYNSIIAKYSAITAQQSAPLQKKVTSLNAAQAELLKIQSLVTKFQDTFLALSDPANQGASTATATTPGVVALSNVANTTATPGSYQIVKTVLATATQIQSSPAANGSINLGAPLVNAGFAITPQNGTNSSGAAAPATLTIDGVQFSFDVNSATLTSVQNAINSNATLGALGVTAAVDGTTGALTLSQTSSAQPLTIGSSGDTGNLLHALKLDSAPITTPGAGIAYQIASSGPVAGINLGATFTPAAAAGYATAVTSGTFTINGVSFSVNAATQNLNNVLTAINSSTAGVVAAYNQTTGAISITNKATGAQSISLGSSTDTSNFLQAVGFLNNYTTPGTLSAGASETVGKPAEVDYLDAQGATQKVFSSSNDVTNVITGVDIKLQQATSTPFTINVAQDSSNLQTAIKNFTTAYNAVMDEINTATAAPVVGSTTSSATGQQVSGALTSGGTLFNNQDVLDLRDQLINLVTATASNSNSRSYNSLASIGMVLDNSFTVQTANAGTNPTNSQNQTNVTTQTFQGTSGRLKDLDVSKLSAALAANPTAVASLLTGTSSIIGNLGAYLTGVTGLPTQLTGGFAGRVPAQALFTMWTSNTSDQITSLQQQIQLVTDQANFQADALRKEFAASEGQIAQFQSLQSSLAGFFKSTG